ncbi:AAA family ATPase [Devosia insulae DS-56]|uniref:AAA family ATPase n=1 Tax=Devosia insulae DS-56 TaxID=1116389 RepID=A0A1E5XLN9_9HYPH|nr:AAA family ATPase [Devosia insulae DS-56]
MPPLANLGCRIMILGPTNSGKSTLAAAMARKLDIPAIHLDRLQHLPNTNWQVRPEEEFAALHDQVILERSWIIDGGYSRLAPQRVRRATGIVVIDASLVTRYRRYFYRTLFQRSRAGALDGEQDSLSWMMLRWLWKSRNAAAKYRQLAVASGLPHVFAGNAEELNRLYALWNLKRK